MAADTLNIIMLTSAGMIFVYRSEQKASLSALPTPSTSLPES